VGPVPQFPPEIERGIDQYLARQAALEAERDTPPLERLDAGVIVPSAADHRPRSNLRAGVPSLD